MKTSAFDLSTCDKCDKPTPYGYGHYIGIGVGDIRVCSECLAKITEHPCVSDKN
jgi:hypothetical protein